MEGKQYNLLIIDENEDQIEDFYGFIENIIRDGKIPATFNLFKITSLNDDEELIDFIVDNEIDAVGIDYKLRENTDAFAKNGDAYLNFILDNYENFPTFIITNNAEDSKSMNADPFKIFPKRIINYDGENATEVEEAQILILKIIESIEKYTENIQDYENELFDLIQKQDSVVALTDDELKRMIYLDSKIEKSISKRQRIPDEWKSPANVENISALVINSEDILNQLKQINNG